MATRMEYQFNNNKKNSPISPIVALLFFVAIMVGFYYLTSLIWTILKFLTPVMLIATAIIDHKVILNYGKWIWNLGKKNWIAGLGAGVLSVIGIPVVSALLLSRALTSRKIKNLTDQYEKQQTSGFTEFEDLSTDKQAEKEVRILELEEKPKQKDPNQYDHLFEDIEIEEEKPKENLWD